MAALQASCMRCMSRTRFVLYRRLTWFQYRIAASIFYFFIGAGLAELASAIPSSASGGIFTVPCPDSAVNGV